MEITRTSPFSGKTHTMELDVTEEQIKEWREGKFAQDAFPNLTPGEREFIMTGYTEAEWDEIFGDGA